MPRYLHEIRKLDEDDDSVVVWDLLNPLHDLSQLGPVLSTRLATHGRVATQSTGLDHTRGTSRGLATGIRALLAFSVLHQALVAPLVTAA